MLGGELCFLSLVIHLQDSQLCGSKPETLHNLFRCCNKCETLIGWDDNGLTGALLTNRCAKGLPEDACSAGSENLLAQMDPEGAYATMQHAAVSLGSMRHYSLFSHAHS